MWKTVAYVLPFSQIQQFDLSVGTTYEKAAIILLKSLWDWTKFELADSVERVKTHKDLLLRLT